MLVTGQKLLASEQIKYSAFSSYFVVLGNRTRDSSAQKIQWNNHKVRANIIIIIYLLFIYLFISIYLFIIIYLFIFIILFRHGLSVFL